ncbi:hypothetical protein [Phaeovulum sp. NW3]|uniref:hypothetical protein n=1 Tax=Phaeovulum sp. NW3 TaxID=2934933 RepID=UPI0020208A39|nr:hypothetical protein [Phaeovulum sp. NW3]MCL7465738.1 hypothetical protein [Phaeovulum sp. NW3]
MARQVMDPGVADPKGLIRESYRIEGIGPAECRSIFLDWALSLAPGVDVAEAMRTVLARHGAGQARHPMTAVLTEGLTRAQETPTRRGGRAARLD